MARYRCAILDDYQKIALSVADWSKVSGDLDIKVFNAHLGGADKVIAALEAFDIVCAMRERTAFPRGVIEKLPQLKLLITTGLRNAAMRMLVPKRTRSVIPARYAIVVIGSSQCPSGPVGCLPPRDPPLAGSA